MPLSSDLPSRIPDSDTAYRLGLAFAAYLDARRIVLGRDPATHSKKIATSFAAGVRYRGVEVMNALICSTEMVAFAASYLNADAAVMVTESNLDAVESPFVFFHGSGERLTADSGYSAIQKLAERRDLRLADKPALHAPVNIVRPYVDFILGHIDTSTLRPLKIVVQTLKGSDESVFDDLEARLPFEFVKLNYQSGSDWLLDRSLPGHLLNVRRTARTVVHSKADFGVILNGDWSRCVILDEQGVEVRKVPLASSMPSSGMLPWLLIAQRVSTTRQPLPELSATGQASVSLGEDRPKPRSATISLTRP